MKKTYIIPTLTVVKIQPQQILAGSVSNNLDGFGGYGGDGDNDDYGD